MVDAIKNLAYGIVSTAPSPATSGTSLVLQAGQGANFPVAPFDATLWPTNSFPTVSNAEIVRVTLVATDTITMTRHQYGTSAQSVVIGYQFAQTITANLISELVVTAALIEALFTANNQIFLGTGSGTGELINLLSALELQFTAGGQIFYGTGAGTAELLSLLTAIEDQFTAAGQILYGTGSGSAELLSLLTAMEDQFTAAGQALIGTGIGTGGLQALFPIRTPHTFNIAGVPSIAIADENPYPGFQISIPSGQVKKLHGVAAVSPTASGGVAYKIRRYTSFNWNDILGFGTTGSPLTSSAGTTSGTVIAPGDVVLADGDVLGLWIVGAGTGATGFRATLFIDTYGA